MPSGKSSSSWCHVPLHVHLLGGTGPASRTGSTSKGCSSASSRAAHVDVEALLGGQVTDTTGPARRMDHRRCVRRPLQGSFATYGRIIVLDLTEVSLDGAQGALWRGGMGSNPRSGRSGWKWSIIAGADGIPFAGHSTERTPTTCDSPHPRWRQPHTEGCSATSKPCTSTAATTRRCSPALRHARPRAPRLRAEATRGRRS